MKADRLRLEVFHHLFAAVAEEMGVSLMRSSFSPNIKERRDFSCALFDAQGRMIAQAAHLPVHLGSTPLSLEAARRAVDMRPGDVVMLNDPFAGGTHLPDVTLISPVFLEGEEQPDFYCVNRAHHADIGGAFPGSMAPARDVHGEGLRLPPVHLVRGGELVADVLNIFLANVRVPAERQGDLLAQWAACRVGMERLAAMHAEYGLDELRARSAQLCEWTSEWMAALIAELPTGEWAFEDSLEWPLQVPGEEPVPGLRIRLRFTCRKGRLVFDFRESDDQSDGPVNTVRAVALSAVFYVLRLLLPQDVPSNDGVLRRVEVLTRSGSVVDACYPAPVAAGNVETSQRLVDVLLGALSQALPDRIPAASAGTMSNLTFGAAEGAGFTYYETVAGGAGGGPAGPGAHALQTHMTNTRNTPVEALEQEFPVRILSYTVRRDSGGPGAEPGGDGVRKRLRFLAPVQLGWVAERQNQGPWGLAGGGRGQPGRASMRAPGSDRDEALPGKIGLRLEAGAEFELETPGGGGFGTPGQDPQGAGDSST